METAARMMNSAMVMKGQEDLFPRWISVNWIYMTEPAAFIKSERRQPLSGEWHSGMSYFHQSSGGRVL